MPGAFAAIADIHGNVWALEAVLSDIDRCGIATVFNLGDSLYGPLAPAATAHLLMARKIPSLRGNQDRVLLDTLPAAHLDWLGEQPCTIEYGDVLMCHGTPESDEVYLTEAVTAHGVELRRLSEIEELLRGVQHRMILCGHSHIPRVIALRDGRTIVNPGSVGLPAYADELPHPHRMETGSPHARYAVIDGDRIELIEVSYDHKAAASKARESGREDWASAIETGFAAR